MKIPKSRKCPCCEASLIKKGVIKSQDERVVHHTTEINLATVRPVCISQKDAYGKLVGCILGWECKRCGCEWLDGQFEEADSGKEL